MRSQAVQMVIVIITYYSENFKFQKHNNSAAKLTAYITTNMSLLFNPYIFTYKDGRK